MQIKEHFLLLLSPLGVDDGRVEVVVIPKLGRKVPLPALLARPALDGELLLHNPGDTGPFLLLALLTQVPEDLILVLSPYFSLRHL
jgi:hypothetical protein